MRQMMDTMERTGEDALEYNSTSPLIVAGNDEYSGKDSLGNKGWTER